MMKQILWGITLSVLVAGSANAALEGRLPATVGGTDYQAYYDDVLDITWMADANAAAGTSYDGMIATSRHGETEPWGTETDGKITGWSARAWLNSLNSANYLGVSNWRLPFGIDSQIMNCDFVYPILPCGLDLQTMKGSTVYSEMAHLYYLTLGNSPRDITNPNTSCPGGPNYCLTNMGPFLNLQPGSYWTSSDWYGEEPGQWTFDFRSGDHGYSYDGYLNHVLPLHDGDISPVPVPAAIWLLGSALAALGALRRRAGREAE